MTLTETRVSESTGRQTVAMSILQRLADKDKSAVKECLDTYGGLIWALAKKYTSSIEEAESVTVDIFSDVWRFGRHGCTTFSNEGQLIRRIACQRLAIYNSGPDSFFRRGKT